MRLPGLNPRRSSSDLQVLTLTYNALDPGPRMDKKKNGSSEPKDAWAEAASHLPRAGTGRGRSPPVVERSKSKSRTPPPCGTGKSSNEVGGTGLGADGGADDGAGKDDDWEAKLDAAVAGAMSKFLPSLKQVVAEQVGDCRKMLTTHEKKLDQHTAQLQGLGERQVGLANEQLDLRRQVEELREKLAFDTGSHLASSSSVSGRPSQRDPDAYDRTLIRIGAEQTVGLKAVEEKVCELAKRTKLAATDYKVEGQPEARNYRLRFTGQPDTAARRADKFIGSLRSDSGWEAIHLDRPAESGGGRQQLFFSLDQSDNQVKKRVRLKKLLAWVRERLPEANKADRDSTITYQWRLVATLGEDLQSIIWEPFAGEKGLNTGEIDNQFRAFLASSIPRRG